MIEINEGKVKWHNHSLNSLYVHQFNNDGYNIKYYEQ